MLSSSLVAHGRCNETWLKGRKYGNDEGCGCSSLGKYKIGNPYHGRFGLAYKLHGLDATNNNAFKRYVVLHSHECVPNNEVAPYPICQSDGCPTVSAAFLKQLAGITGQEPETCIVVHLRVRENTQLQSKSGTLVREHNLFLSCTASHSLILP